MQIRQYDNQSLERINALYERRIDEIEKYGLSLRLIGNVASLVLIILYVLVGMFFNLPDKIGRIVYGFILPVVISVLCIYCLPVFFLKKKIRKTILTGVRGIKLVK